MNFSLRPHPLIAHWVPGVVVVATALLAWSDWSVINVLAVFAGDPSKAAVSVLVLSVFAFVIGEILDSYRNCREDNEVNWNFFFDSDKEKVKRLDEYYFTYYVLNKNLASAIGLAWLIFIVHPPELALWKLPFCKLLPNTQIGWLSGPTSWLGLLVATLLASVAIWILRADAGALRNEIKEHTKKTT
jgi:hypothetical protein